MTATPIPRTLALTIYGDLDFSVIEEMPPRRVAVETLILDENQRGRVFEFIRAKAREGQQAYVVYPVIEESSRADLRPAVRMYEEIRRTVFPELSVGLLHGRLASEEKEAVMRDFKAGGIRVLVSTTVVEVGVDVPNATVMMIEHAERFGLAQLHQLRGRIGRGERKSTCFLVAGAPTNPAAEERLRALVATSDGFKIAEMDLKLRGPGEFFGTRAIRRFELPICCATRKSSNGPSARRRVLSSGLRRKKSSTATCAFSARTGRAVMASQRSPKSVRRPLSVVSCDEQWLRTSGLGAGDWGQGTGD